MKITCAIAILESNFCIVQSGLINMKLSQPCQFIVKNTRSYILFALLFISISTLILESANISIEEKNNYLLIKN